jgi:hypothetical protein
VRTIDINSDMGEHDSQDFLAREAQLMPLIMSVNIACGVHAGNPDLMRRTARLASQYGRGDHERSARAGNCDQCGNGHRCPVASRLLQSPWFGMFDYDVYALCGDGCMMEGVAAEAASLAAHLLSRSPNSAYDSSGIPHMLFLKEVFDHLGLFLPPMQMTPHGLEEFSPVRRAASP